MKRRSGFVSNSSSSSFCLILKEEDHQDIIKDLHPFYQSFFNALLSKQTLGDINLRTFMQWAVRGSSSYPKLANCYFEYDGELPKEILDRKSVV